jgi:2,4-dienoyl-CoA reductase (NADPH2)
LNAPKNPLGCYEPARFDGDWQRMVDEIMAVYATKPTLHIPPMPARAEVP